MWVAPKVRSDGLQIFSDLRESGLLNPQLYLGKDIGDVFCLYKLGAV